MKSFRQSWLVRSRYPHAMAAGVLLALAFPKWEISGLAWVAPALMLGAAAGTDGKHSFRIGYIAGLAYHLTSLYWILLIPVTFFPILGWLALSGFLSLYTALWVWGAWRMWPLRRVSVQHHNESDWLLPVDWPPWVLRAGWAFGVAALWVGLEVVRARLLGGFPWNPLGASQFNLTPLIQIASVTGVYGVSFLVIWFSAGLLCAGLGLLRARLHRSTGFADLAMPLLVAAVCFAWGLNTIRTAPRPSRALRVAAIQPSIPQTAIWDETENAARFAEVLQLSHQALTQIPDLLLWPEAAVPDLLRWSETSYPAVRDLAQSNATWMILGADDALPSDTSDDETLYYNCAWLIDTNGEVRATYRKQHLVAFGEEVPFSHWLPFLKWFTPITGAFTRGTEFVVFPMDTLGVETTPLICFEDVFPHLVRRGVSAHTDFLVNLTNDGWFREGAAQRQQAANSVFRAVENGRPLIRCTNNGQTCWADQFGRIVETFTDKEGTIYGAGWVVFSVGITDTTNRVATFYNRHGDIFGWLCAGLSFSLLLVLLFRYRATDSL